MKLHEAKQAIDELGSYLRGGALAARVPPSIVKQTYHMEARELQPLCAGSPNLRTSGIGTMCGVYFFVRLTGDIVYIGKATKRNLHSEIWSKLCTPEVNQGAQTYPQNWWTSNSRSPEICGEVVSGQLAVAAAAIEPAELSSLCEVYLHTLCELQEGRLPALNRRIG